MKQNQGNMHASVEKALNDLAVLTQRTIGKRYGVDEVIAKISVYLSKFCGGKVVRIFVNDGHRLFNSWQLDCERADKSDGEHFLVDALHPWCRAAAEKTVVLDSGARCEGGGCMSTISIPAICHVRPDDPMRRNEMTPVVFLVETSHHADDFSFRRDASMLCRAIGTVVMAATATDIQRAYARALELMTEAKPGHDNTSVYSAAFAELLEAAMKWYPLCTHYSVDEARDDLLFVIASNEPMLVGTVHPVVETASGQLYLDDALTWHYYFDYDADPACQGDPEQSDPHLIAGRPSPNKQVLQEVTPKSQFNARIGARFASINLESHEARAFGPYATYYVRQAACYLDELLTIRDALERDERQLNVCKSILAGTRFSRDEIHRLFNDIALAQGELAEHVEGLRQEGSRRQTWDAQIAAKLDRVGDNIREYLLGATRRACSDDSVGERYVVPARVFRQVESEFAQEFRKKGIGFTINCDGLSPGWAVDFPMLRGAIHEFLTNVLKHARPRLAIPLKCELACRVNSETGRHTCEISVRDNGVGMSSTEVAAANRDSQSNGARSGLSRFREHTLAFGGDFRVKSGVNDGTRITMRVLLLNRNSDNK